MQKFQIAVIGGGASGMMAAIAAARSGAKVVILEKNKKLGKKLLSTGNGRCNFTNEYMSAKCYRSDHPEYIPKVLGQFTEEQTVSFFRELGILPKSRNGYLYPQPDQAAAVLDALFMELRRLHVSMFCGCTVNKLYRHDNGFEIHTAKNVYYAKKVILSSGSLAAPQLGASGEGYEIAASFGHRLSPVVPALVQLISKEGYFRELAGIRIDAKAAVFVEGEKLCSDQGEVQLTAYGISGIPVFQISRYASKALDAGKRVEVRLDLLPGQDFSWITGELARLCAFDGRRRAEQLLSGFFNQKLIPVLLGRAGIKAGTFASDLKRTDLERLVSTIKDFRVPVSGTKSMEQAQICAGGVDLSGIDPDSMESRKQKGLYITGELLDVDGICGGYNLQWAWSSGWIAGTHAAR